MTINEAMIWMKTLKERHGELTSLRNENSAVHIRRYGVGGDKETEKKPVYSVVELDRSISMLALEIRRLDQQIKATNAVTEVLNYTANESVLGQLTLA